MANKKVRKDEVAVKGSMTLGTGADRTYTVRLGLLSTRRLVCDIENPSASAPSQTEISCVFAKVANSDPSGSRKIQAAIF